MQRVRAVRERVLSSERWMQTAMTTNDSSEAQRLYLNRCRSFNLELGLEPRKINIADCVTFKRLCCLHFQSVTERLPSLVAVQKNK